VVRIDWCGRLIMSSGDAMGNIMEIALWGVMWFAIGVLCGATFAILRTVWTRRLAARRVLRRQQHVQAADAESSERPQTPPPLVTPASATVHATRGSPPRVPR
jgi:hypothetical protein